MSFDPERLTRIDRHFARYVDDGRLAGWQVQVGQHGQVAHRASCGMADKEAGRAVADDTLWRLYSMTKPITSIAAMLLWEQGAFELTDPVSRYIPSFVDVQVYDKGSAQKPYLVPATEPVRMWHLMSHTSGLTYGFLHTHPVDALYRAAGYEWGSPKGTDLAAACDAWAALPLLFQPGSAWGYGVSTDVLGRVVEVLSGQTLEEFVKARILEPLGMSDTRWWVDEPDRDRLAALYVPMPGTGEAVRYDVMGDAALREPTFLSGGGGLISTTDDYWQLCRLLVGRGEVDGTRLLAPRTVDFMARNHLPGGQDLGALSTGGFAETTFAGTGFGLGFAVTLDPVPARVPASVGEYYWGGAASTAFWVDPLTGVSAVWMAQLLPSSTHPIRPQLRQLVSSALTG